MQRARGFTLVELMVVVAIIGLLAAIALPRLGAKGRSAADTEAWSRTIASSLDQLRVRAMSERRRTRATFRNNSITLETETAPGTWIVDATRTAPPDACVWDVKTTSAAPTTIMDLATTHTVQFEPTFRALIDSGPSTNGWIFVGSPRLGDLKQGRTYLVTVIGSGAVNRVDRWTN